jgi:hypothetical protein
VLTGIAIQVISARSQRDAEQENWKRQRADIRNDHQRETIVDLQLKLRAFRTALIAEADDDLDPQTDDEWPHLRAYWEADDELRLVISHVADAALRDAATTARAALQDACGPENRLSLSAALREAQPSLDAVDALVTEQLSRL